MPCVAIIRLISHCSAQALLWLSLKAAHSDFGLDLPGQMQRHQQLRCSSCSSVMAQALQAVLGLHHICQN